MRVLGLFHISPRRMLRWPRLLLAILALAALSAAIWFGGEMLGMSPFDGFWFRVWVIAGIWTLATAIWLFRIFRRRRAARTLEEAMVPVEPTGDGKVLSERMQTALETLRKSGGRSYLYDLPWYVIIGPPGAGKTTALLNAGIEFPLAQNGGAVEGFGGTRFCDWWFAEDAILVDTAGRYTTQDSDAKADGASWKSFLELLKKSRPKQPINGVILAFSVEDMMKSDPESRARHAQTVRARLAEVHETLKVDFPVYVLFTKSDLIAGFREYFSLFSLSRRNSVWGVTFQTKDRKALTYEAVPGEFDKLTARLSEEVIDRLNEEPDGVSRISIFGLPGQMAMLKEPVTDFLRRVFEPTRYKSNAILRGFYFTSGTQEGTPIDQVLGAVGEAGGLTPGFGAGFMSGKGKSFFLHDLLKKVIFAERDWVSFDRKAVRRDRIIRGTSTAMIVILTLGALGGFGYSFWRNTALVKQADEQSAAYFRNAETELARREISDPSLDAVVPLLDELRLMPVGYGAGREPSTWEGLGLGQYDRLQAAATESYSDALELMFRPRLLLSVQMALADLESRNDVTGIYRALKVYLLLGRQGEVKDDAAIIGWFRAEWQRAYPSASQINLRDRLEGHLTAMLQLDDARNILVDLDTTTVERARQAVVQLSPTEQAYALLMDGAAAARLPDWSLAQAGGNAANLVFTTRDGSDLAQLTVPAVYTYEGFWSYFYPQLLQVADNLRKDQWVLGDVQKTVDFEEQLNRLDRTLIDRYRIDFQAQWNKALNNIALRSLVADKPDYRVLGAAVSKTASPMLLLVRAVDDQTRLSREFDGLAGVTPDTLLSGSVPEGVSKEVLDRMRSRTGAMQRILFDAVMADAAPGLPGGAAAAPSNDGLKRQVERIEEDFSMWYALLEGEPDMRPIDAVLGNLGSIWSSLRVTGRSGDTDPMMPQLLANLTQYNSQLPPPLTALIDDAERDFRQGASDANLEVMNRALQDRVTFFCRDVIAPSFPFARSERNLSIDNFSKFFGPGGDMEKYYNEYLAAHTERPEGVLRYRDDSPLAGRLNLATLRQFERAERIRQAFFGGSSKPQVEIAVTHVDSHPSVKSAILIINDTRITTVPREAPKTAIWPGTGSATVVQLSPADGPQNSLGFTGSPWTIIPFMNAAASSQTRGDTTRATFVIGGRSITYDFTINALVNPFTMPELREFQCPTSLD